MLAIILAWLIVQPDPARDPVPGLFFLNEQELTLVSAPEATARAQEVRAQYRKAAAMIRWPDVEDEPSMLESARKRYELAIYAVGRGDTTGPESVRFFQSAQPCYEWEGYHDCPEREAAFAERELTGTWPALRHFLPLLAAPRWLCAAEGYDHERDAAGAARARANAARLFPIALRSDDPLVRVAASIVQQRGTCSPKR